MTRGIWQIGKADTTVEEAAAVVQELNSRNILYSQRTLQVAERALEVAERAVVVKEEEEAAERKRKVVSGVMWGGIGLGMVVVMIFALR